MGKRSPRDQAFSETWSRSHLKWRTGAAEGTHSWQLGWGICSTSVQERRVTPHPMKQEIGGLPVEEATRLAKAAGCVASPPAAKPAQRPPNRSCSLSGCRQCTECGETGGEWAVQWILGCAAVPGAVPRWPPEVCLEPWLATVLRPGESPGKAKCALIPLLPPGQDGSHPPRTGNGRQQTRGEEAAQLESGGG
ncbi:hypothetical protein NDU88_005089 [Pleurodeles waltl]|uniref:Uncharacterized protein n=1 Tax=Pleurodeles waltl TaxID=8319 RepID=A0AAV7RMA8_PLEWA|nr:hypothetical protein NDU88_005089 [Pleurodeles waltl]